MHEVAKVQGGDVPKGRDARMTARKGGNKLSRITEIGYAQSKFKTHSHNFQCYLSHLSD
jgi:hypothetical protein